MTRTLCPEQLREEALHYMQALSRGAQVPEGGDGAQTNEGV